MVPWSSFVGLRFTFRFVEFSSQLWWFPGFLEAPQLQLRDLLYGEAPGAHRASFQQKMLLFCFHPMTKVNTWAVSSIFRGVFRSGFKTYEWRQHVSASIEHGRLIPAMFLFSHLAGRGRELWRCLPPGSSTTEVCVLWKGLCSFLKCSQSPRPENKTRRLY